MIQITVLDPVSPVVTKDDPNWLRNRFGVLPSIIDLTTGHFPYIDGWPEEKPGRNFVVVWFKDEVLPNWDAVNKRLTAEGFGSGNRSFPFDLACYIVPHVDELWRKCKEDNCPVCIYTSDSESVYYDGERFLFLPGVNLRPGFREIDAHWVEKSFNDNAGFLIFRE